MKLKQLAAALAGAGALVAALPAHAGALAMALTQDEVIFTLLRLDKNRFCFVKGFCFSSVDN